VAPARRAGREHVYEGRPADLAGLLDLLYYNLGLREW
jgi:hypothetical protein